jgi:ubiquinone/menaquinone biosynthesis C-methylase UbiE
MMPWIALLIFILLIVLLFWELRVCEGAHLGPRFVVWLYDLVAFRYDRIKGFDLDWEQRFLGEPIVELLSALPDARLLDVGAGTGRLSRTLIPYGNFNGSVVNLEPSKAMLSIGSQLTKSEKMLWIQAFAIPLPFQSGIFDIVSSLEVLEFTPDPQATLSELFRVLHPGGWLIITNRIGWEARWILGHYFKRDRFSTILEEAGLQDITVYPWQMDYDLAWARKPYATEKGIGVP